MLHNPRFREVIREPMAEAFGVAILIIFGTGVDCQSVLSANPLVSATPKGVSVPPRIRRHDKTDRCRPPRIGQAWRSAGRAVRHDLICRSDIAPDADPDV